MISRVVYGLAGLLLLSCPCVLSAQDTVTIPKSRLEELERKEAELKKLQGGGTNNLTAASQKVAQPAKSPAPVATPALATPPAAPLPPFKPGDTLEATDLANAFRSDPAAAEHLYQKKPMAVRGEIVRFHKQMLSRSYIVVLKTADPVVTVACEVSPPDVYGATFTSKNGSELVGQIGESRTTLAKVGEHVMVLGRCGKFKDGAVQFKASDLRPAAANP